MHYPAIEQPSPGEWTEIVKGVLWLRMPLPFELDHINLYLVEDDDADEKDGGAKYSRVAEAAPGEGAAT